MDCALVFETFSEPYRYVYARRAFSSGEAGGGELRLATDGYALVWVNGDYVGRTYVRAHAEEMRYQTFDLSGHLRAGQNVLAMLLHRWGPPEAEIPGVPRNRPIAFCCEGTAGDVDLGDVSAWRVHPAAEYRPARRHNSLIGHEEDRDLRAEPAGWRQAGFDDGAWVAPTCGPLGERRFVASPLRPLAEETIFPARIVAQGALAEGAMFRAPAPETGDRHWRLEVDAGEAIDGWLFFENRPGSRLSVDGEEKVHPIDLPFHWFGRLQPLALSLPPGRHVVDGFHPGGGALGFGWRPLPPGGERIAWGPSADGPFQAGPAPQPDPDAKPLADSLIPDRRCDLGEEGQVELDVRDEEFSLVFQFPYSITMLPRLEIEDASAGAQIELIYSERLSGVEGLTIPAAYTDRVTLRAGAQTHEVSFQYKSARILIVNIRARGGFVKLKRVRATFRHYDYEPVGAFACNDERLERIWEICRNTMVGGSQEFIVDGPWREQLLYIGDNHVHNRACYHLFGNHEIVRWQHMLYAAGQMPDGIFQPNQPYRTGPEEYRLLDQTILWPMQLEHHRLYTGDEGFVEGLLPNMVRLMDGFREQFGGLGGDVRLRDVTGWNWVDHPGLVDGLPREIRHDGIPSGINMLYVQSLDASVRLLRAYGQESEAVRLARVAASLREGLLAEHWDAGRSLFADCVVGGGPSPEASVHVNLLAIEADLPDDVGVLLARTWKQPGVLQICGAFFRIHLFEVLRRLGRFADILADTREFWGGMIDGGLTTTAEFMPICGEWGGSVGHPWGASPAIHFAESIAGLRPLAPGWRRTSLDPHLCDLTSLSVRVPTPAGPIEADLRAEDGGVAGTVTVPRGIEIVPARAELAETIAIRS